MTVLYLHFGTMATSLVLLITVRQCYCVWVAFPPPLQSSFSSANNQNSEMQSNAGTVCNSTCVKCSHSSVPAGNLLSNVLKQKDVCVQKWLYFCIQGIFQEMMLYFPIAEAKQYWRKVLFCYSVWELIARIQET